MTTDQLPPTPPVTQTQDEIATVTVQPTPHRSRALISAMSARLIMETGPFALQVTNDEAHVEGLRHTRWRG